MTRGYGSGFLERILSGYVGIKYHNEGQNFFCGGGERRVGAE